MRPTVWSDLCGNCEFCGMDMEMDPYCVNKEVLKKRTEITGKTYPFGLDISRAIDLCQGDFKVVEVKQNSVDLNLITL